MKACVPPYLHNDSINIRCLQHGFTPTPTDQWSDAVFRNMPPQPIAQTITRTEQQPEGALKARADKPQGLATIRTTSCFNLRSVGGDFLRKRKRKWHPWTATQVAGPVSLLPEGAWRAVYATLRSSAENGVNKGEPVNWRCFKHPDLWLGKNILGCTSWVYI